MNKKKDIFLEGKLHIPLVAQFRIKNAAIEVQLGRIFVQFRELSRPRRDCRRIRRRRRRWRGLAAPLSHWKDEGEAEAFCFTHTIQNCTRNQGGLLDLVIFMFEGSRRCCWRSWHFEKSTFSFSQLNKKNILPRSIFEKCNVWRQWAGLSKKSIFNPQNWPPPPPPPIEKNGDFLYLWLLKINF